MDIGYCFDRCAVFVKYPDFQAAIRAFIFVQLFQTLFRNFIDSSDDLLSSEEPDAGFTSSPLSGPADKYQLIVRQGSPKQRLAFGAAFPHLFLVQIGSVGKIIHRSFSYSGNSSLSISLSLSRPFSS